LEPSVTNQLRFFLTVIVLFGFLPKIATAGSSILLPDKAKIEKYRIKIKSMSTIGKAIFVGMQGMLLAASGYVLYRWCSLDKKPLGNEVLTNNQLTSRLLQVETKYVQQFDAKIFSIQWFKNISRGIYNDWAIAIGSLFLLEKTKKVYAHYSCFENLETFINSNKYIIGSVERMLSLLESFDSEIVDTKDLQGLFVVSCNNFVDGIEAIIAFMEHKLIQLTNESGLVLQEERLIPNYLFVSTTSFCGKVQVLLNNYENVNKVSLCSLVSEFRYCFIKFVESFKFFECRIAWKFA